MTALPWISDLDSVLGLAAKEVGLTGSTSAAFDGDAWVWIWRDYLDDPQRIGDSRVVDLRVRAWPDDLGLFPRMELIASAWRLKSRNAAWSLTFWAGYIEPTGMLTSDFHDFLVKLMAGAWGTAHTAAERIVLEPDSRERALGMLSQRGVSVRLRDGVLDPGPNDSAHMSPPR